MDIGDYLFLDGNITTIDLLEMKRSSDEEWMPVKYGELMRPWKVQVQIPNKESGEEGKWKSFTNANEVTYKYEFRNQSRNMYMVEREPARRFIIRDPHDYNGQLGGYNTDLWSNCEEVFVVNGFVNKGDGNFEGPFVLKTLEETGITIGSYPGNESDIMAIKNAGCTAVLDVQAEYRSIDFAKAQAMFRKAGINVVKNVPIRDFQLEECQAAYFRAACELDKLINEQGQHVFVHCFTGISRAPTLVVLYWALFLRHEKWNDPGELARYLKGQYDLSHPNLEMVQTVVEGNQIFQNQQRLRQEEEDAARRAHIMKMDKMNQLKNMKDEYERLKRKRLAEAEAEKSRLQRVKFAEDEALRKWQQEQDDLERERRRKERELENLLRANRERDEDADRQRQLRLAKEQKEFDDELERIRRETEAQVSRAKQI